MYNLFNRPVLFLWCRNETHPLLKQCFVGVKLPSEIRSTDVASLESTTNFQNLMKYLRDSKLVALLSCDKNGRIGFLMPASTNDAGCHDCIGIVSYGPMNSFITWTKLAQHRSPIPSLETVTEKIR